MSVLERYVQIRHLRNCAAAYYDRASETFSFSVRARYLTIADHYTALAEAELHAERKNRRARLEQLRIDRENTAASADSQCTDQVTLRVPGSPKLRVIQGDGPSTSRQWNKVPQKGNWKPVPDWEKIGSLRK
jgi:hypothetical protein